MVALHYLPNKRVMGTLPRDARCRICSSFIKKIKSGNEKWSAWWEIIGTWSYHSTVEKCFWCFSFPSSKIKCSEVGWKLTWQVREHRLSTITSSFSDKATCCCLAQHKRSTAENVFIYGFPFPLVLLLIGISAHWNACTICLAHTYTHTALERWTEQVLPLISAFHYAGASTGGYFAKHSLSPAFFYEMKITTMGEKS